MNPPGWTPCAELAAVVALTGAGIAPETAPRLALGRVDWIAVATLALSHNVAGLVHRALSAGHAPDAPPHIANAFARHAAAIANRNEAALGEFLRLRAVLDRRGVASMPLKGPWLGQRLYGDMAARPSRDVDLLVSPQDWPRALTVLDEADYPTHTGLSPRQFAAKARTAGQLLFHRRDGRFVVEPHFAVAPRTLSVDLDHAALWQRAQAESHAGLTLPTLAAEDELILLAVHGFKEEWTRLKWFADFGAFLHVRTSLDWGIVAERARRQGVLGIVETALALVKIAFAIPHSRPELFDRRQTYAIREILHRMDETARASRGVAAETNIYRVSPIRLAMRERRMDQARYVARSLFTPQERHFRTFRLPDRMFGAYYLIKPIQDCVLIPTWHVLKSARRVVTSRASRRQRARYL